MKPHYKDIFSNNRFYIVTSAYSDYPYFKNFNVGDVVKPYGFYYGKQRPSLNIFSYNISDLFPLANWELKFAHTVLDWYGIVYEEDTFFIKSPKNSYFRNFSSYEEMIKCEL